MAGVKLKTARVLLGDCLLDDCMYHATEAVPAMMFSVTDQRKLLLCSVSAKGNAIKYVFWTEYRNSSEICNKRSDFEIKQFILYFGI